VALQEAARDEHQIEVKSSRNGYQPERTVEKAATAPPRVSTSRNRKARVNARSYPQRRAPQRRRDRHDRHDVS
jgi:hypothetical protein